MTANIDTETHAKLERIAAHERTLRATPLNRFFNAVAPTRLFASIYSKLGPTLDRPMLKGRGKLVGRMYGFQVLLLVTTGKKTGARRESPLLYARDGENFVIVGTNFGSTVHPSWTENLLAQPRAQIVVADETLDVQAELVDEANWQQMWPKLVTVYGGYAKYLERTGGRIPRIFVLRPISR